MASLTRWIWVSVNSGSWWWTGRPGVLRFMRSQRVGHDWVTDLIWCIIPWTEEPSGLQSTGLQRVGHNCATNTHTCLSQYKVCLNPLYTLLSQASQLPWMPRAEAQRLSNNDDIRAAAAVSVSPVVGTEGPVKGWVCPEGTLGDGGRCPYGTEGTLGLSGVWSRRPTTCSVGTRGLNTAFLTPRAEGFGQCGQQSGPALLCHQWEGVWGAGTLGSSPAPLWAWGLSKFLRGPCSSGRPSPHLLWGWVTAAPFCLKSCLPGHKQSESGLYSILKTTCFASQHGNTVNLKRLPVNLKGITLNIHWKDWCWSSNTLATWCEQPTHGKRPWCWEWLRAGGEGGDRGWDKMGRWYHWLNGHKSEQTLGDSEGQGSLVCCSPWGRQGSDMTEWRNNEQKD